MVKTHVKTELSVCLFLLAQGGMVMTGGVSPLPDGAGMRTAERALPHLIPSHLCLCAVWCYLQNLSDLHA